MQILDNIMEKNKRRKAQRAKHLYQVKEAENLLEPLARHPLALALTLRRKDGFGKKN